jgi:hypothetical protein
MIALRFSQLSYSTKSIAINAFIMFLWWFAFNPGFYSTDSFGVLEMARSGQLSSAWTAIWAIFVKFLTFNGSHPEIATLFFSQLLGYSVSVFAMTLFKGKTAMWSSAILCGSPLVGAMGITLWHDIPMTSGFLLMLVGAKKIEQEKKSAIYFFCIGSFFSSFRYNGIPTLILASIIFFLFTKNKRRLLMGVISIFVIGCLTTSLNFAFQNSKNVQSDGFIDWMRYDLSCYAAISNDESFFLEQFDNGPTVNDWRSESACTWFNTSKAFSLQSDSVNEKVPTAWLALALKSPSFVFKTHLDRHKYLIPIPYTGLPSMPFIHSTIEYANLGIEFRNPTISENLRVYPRLWNFFRYIFGYAGLWLAFILFLSWRRKDLWLFKIGLVGSILNLSLFVFASISDGRFALFTLIAGQLVLVGELVERARVPLTHRNLLGFPDPQ